MFSESEKRGSIWTDFLARQLANVHTTVQSFPDPQFFPLIEVWYYFVHTCMCMT